LVLWFFGSLVLWFFGSLVLWFFGSLVLWFFGSLVLWFFRSLVLWFFGSFVLWFFGSFVLWFFRSFDEERASTFQRDSIIMKRFSATLTGHIDVDTDQQCDAEILIENILRDVRATLAERGSIKDSSLAVLKIEEVTETEQ
jgi:signal transduction histidine kinase